MQKVQTQIAIDNRKSLKQAIYVRNRRYTQLVETSIVQNFKIVQTSRDIDSGYLSVIERLKRKRYDRNQISNLIDLLGHEDFLQVYKGVIGLKSFNQRVIIRENQEGFLGSGIVPKLAQIIHWKQHPYIKQSCLLLLNDIIKSMNSENLRVFCNSETIPFTFFIEAIKFSQNNFNFILQILSELNQRGNYMNFSNTSLLDGIDQLISRNQSQWSPKIKMIQNMLNVINVYFRPQRRQFANKYYRIRDKILSIFIANNMIDQVLYEMQIHIDKNKMIGICKTINEYPTQVPFIADYIQKLVYKGFQLNFGKSSIFHLLLSTIVLVKQSKKIFPTKHLLNLIQGAVFKIDIKRNSLNQSQSYKLQECIYILYNIMHFAGDNYREILERRPLFQHLFQSYKYYKRKIICQLNQIVRFMVQHSSKSEYMALIRDFELIDKYFKNCNKSNQMTAKGSLKYMMQSLILLKRKEPQQYETIRKMVVTDENYKIINQIKEESYLSKIQSIFQFYQNLKEEVRISNVQPIPSNEIPNNHLVTTLENLNNNIGNSFNENQENIVIQEESQHNLNQVNEFSEIPQNDQRIIIQRNQVVIDADVIIMNDQ